MGQVRTARGDGNLSVEFNEQLWMPVMVPTMTHRIELSLWDNNVVGKDSVVANAYFSFQDLQVSRDVPCWPKSRFSPYFLLVPRRARLYVLMLFLRRTAQAVVYEQMKRLGKKVPTVSGSEPPCAP